MSAVESLYGSLWISAAQRWLHTARSRNYAEAMEWMLLEEHLLSVSRLT
jgi:hypothetical protein